MRRIGYIALLAVCLGSTAHARDLHEFTLPGGQSTCGLGIASDGTVVGDDPTQLQTGNFVYKDRTFSYPAPNFTGGFSLLGINRAHVIVGAYGGLGGDGAFILSGGVTTLFTLPGAGFVLASSINDAGTIVGTYQAAHGGPYLGFIDAGGIVTTLSNGSGDTEPAGIDPSGRIVVGTSVSSAGVFTGFITKDGIFTTLAVPGAAATFARGVDRRGRVSGTFFTSLTTPVAQGFLYDHGSYAIYDVPGATATQLGSMNGAGEVTGCFTDAAGTHGLRARL
jgi:uncharacterized membrane protein